jgi:hypothetical protein
MPGEKDQRVPNACQLCDGVSQALLVNLRHERLDVSVDLLAALRDALGASGLERGRLRAGRELEEPPQDGQELGQARDLPAGLTGSAHLDGHHPELARGAHVRGVLRHEHHVVVRQSRLDLVDRGPEEARVGLLRADVGRQCDAPVGRREVARQTKAAQARQVLLPQPSRLGRGWGLPVVGEKRQLGGIAFAVA